MAIKSLSKTKLKSLVARKVVGIAPGKSRGSVPEEQRLMMIREAAYFRAQNAGFCGDSAEHWFAAEAEIDRQLRRN